MGNNPPHGIPKLILKNWLPVPELPNTYKNRLTGQFAHKHIVVIEDQQQIQSFKFRMKETNEAICRILFYHHYCDNIYHVYTDQMLPYNHSSSKTHLWNQSQITIIQSFQQLMRVYGYMRICQQMVGIDSMGKPKVWININPVSAHVWNKASSEKQMVMDLINCLQKISMHVSRSSQSEIKKTKEYNSFEEVARDYSEISSPVGNQNSCTSTFVDNTTTNFNININIDIEKEKGHKLQKIFNPVLCETSRNENEQSKANNENRVKPKKNELSMNQKIMQQQRLNRPTTNYCESFHLPLNSQFRHPKSSNLLPIYTVSYRNPHPKQGSSKPLKESPPKSENERKRFSKRSGFKNVFTDEKSRVKKANLSNYRPISQFNNSLPKFLKKQQNEQRLQKQRAKTQIPENQHPTTERNEKFYDGKQFENQAGKLFGEYVESFDEIVKKRKHYPSQHSIEPPKNAKKSQLLKEEIQNLLESDEQPVSPEYEQFKQFSLYKKDEVKEKEKQQDEIELIKEKVEKKKATFADLKMEALKILEDDF